MLAKGPAKKVTIYVNEETRHHMQPLWVAIFDFLRHKKVAGATVTHSRMSFGNRQLVHRSDTPETPEFAFRIEFVETTERVDEVLPTLYEMVTDGLIELHDTTVLKAVMKDRRRPEPRQPHERRQMQAKMMRVFLGEADKWHGDPLYDAIVKRLRMMDVAGATVYRGILGYGVKGHTHKQGLLHFSHDLPIMITVVDAPQKIAEAAAAVEEMLGDGLIVVSDVDAVRLVHSLPEVTDAGKVSS
jgi:PII-like signaling protein